MRNAFAVGAALLALAAHAQSMPPTASFRGFSGLLDTPDAFVLQDGSAELSFTNERDPRYLSSSNTNAFLAFGFLPYLELSGRFSEIRPGPRDLSGNAKVELPLFLLNRWLPAVGLGVTDLGSSVPYFRSKYGVLTESLPYARLSLGYGLGPDQLDGAFGGVEVMPVSWAALLAEYDTRAWNTGVKLSVPIPWGGTGIRLEGIAKAAVSKPREHFAFAAGLQIPLSFHAPAEDSAELDRVPPQRVARPESLGVRLERLENALVEIGFENVRVGTGADTFAVGRPLPQVKVLQNKDPVATVPQSQVPVARISEPIAGGSPLPQAKGNSVFIQVENNVFNANELDALGVILGTAAQVVPDSVGNVTVQLRKNDLPVYEVSASLTELVGFFFQQPPASLHLDVRTRITDDSRIAFAGPPRNGTFLHSQLILSPKLTTFIGTEVGPFDAILALRPELKTRLWKGAAFDLRFEIPVLWTSNFSDAGPLRSLRPDPRIENALLYQSIRLAPGLYALAGAGLYQSSAGGLGELSWITSDGHHRVSLHAGLTAPRNGYQVESAVAAYRYFFTPLGLTGELAGGRFLNGDDGVRVTLSRDFGDTRLSLLYLHTTSQQVGIAISLPLTPRKDLKPGWAQFKGTSRWHFRQTTTVGHEGSNPLHLGLGQLAESALTLEDDVLNGDRVGESYLNAHLDRLREAYFRWNLSSLGDPRIDHP